MVRNRDIECCHLIEKSASGVDILMKLKPIYSATETSLNNYLLEIQTGQFKIKAVFSEENY